MPCLNAVFSSFQEASLVNLVATSLQASSSCREVATAPQQSPWPLLSGGVALRSLLIGALPARVQDNPKGRAANGVLLSAPKSRDSLRLRRRFLPLPEKSRDFLRPQGARFPLRRKSLANCDLFCNENG